MARVEGQVDSDRDGHAAKRGDHREQDPAPLPQFAQIELPPRLEPYDEEEQRHQALVHPLAEVERYTRAAESYRELRRPDRLVRRVIDVGPDKRDQRRREQEERAARLRPQVVASGRRQVPCPGGPCC